MSERQKNDKPKICFNRHWKKWWALSAWDLGPEDNETWRLNIKANEFARALNSRLTDAGPADGGR